MLKHGYLENGSSVGRRTRLNKLPPCFVSRHCSYYAIRIRFDHVMTVHQLDIKLINGH
ncbi:hypothetical protein DICVIV_12643 [Dictyocaulus viviparus]|uniref:Uncharacterized protein n=1 Tax=Dictyocaulus viviparus TaxID=29172 RepID=A0A0D8XC94_DICVI|nr:hypothetical protein DICVIV_12643 [Dictyocaulus viviparus]